MMKWPSEITQDRQLIEGNRLPIGNLLQPTFGILSVVEMGLPVTLNSSIQLWQLQ